MIGSDITSSELFERFARECGKDHVEPHDWLQFFDLLIYMHTSGKFLVEAELTYALQARGFDARVVAELSQSFNNGLVLLRAYDRFKLGIEAHNEGDD